MSKIILPGAGEQTESGLIQAVPGVGEAQDEEARKKEHKEAFKRSLKIAAEVHKEMLSEVGGGVSWDHLAMLAEIWREFERAVVMSEPKLDGDGSKLMTTMEYGGSTLDVPQTWGPDSTFPEYCRFRRWFLGKQLKFAREFLEEKRTPMSKLMGDELAGNMDFMPPGMDVEYGAEQFEILEFYTRRQIESINEYLDGRVNLDSIIMRSIEKGHAEDKVTPLDAEHPEQVK